MRSGIALGPILAWIMGLSCASLHAGAWTQEQGHGQVILSFSFMDLSRWFDSSGKPQSFADHGSFRQTEINPYVEYGLNSKTTLVLNTFVPWMRYGDDYGSASSGGWGDTEIGVRRRLSGESRTVVSVQFTVKVPMYPASRTPAPGNHQVDLEPGVEVGRGGTVAARHVFVSAGAAYRRRDGAPADQFRSDVTFGMDFNRRFTGMVQYFGITGMRNGTPVQTGGNPNVESDFDLYKAEFSMVTRVQSHTRLQIGWVASLAGRNTGAGGTLLGAIWRDF